MSARRWSKEEGVVPIVDTPGLVMLISSVNQQGAAAVLTKTMLPLEIRKGKVLFPPSSLIGLGPILMITFTCYEKCASLGNL